MTETPVDDSIGKSLSFVGSTLVVSDPAHLEKLDRSRWSASGMKSFESCPSRWVIEKLLPEEPDPFGPAEKGSAAHKVFEVLFSLPPKMRTKARASRILDTLHIDFADEIDAPADEADLTMWRGKVMELIMPLWDIEEPADVNVHACEEEIKGEVGGVPLIGYMDRTDVGPNGGYVIKDYKTGKASTEATRKRFGDPHGDQLRLYARAIENRDGKSPESAFIYYTGAGTSYEADLSKAAIDAVEHEFVETYNEMKASAASGEYRTNAGPLCGWCPLATVCPTAQKAGRDAPKVEKAKLGTALGIRVVDKRPAPDEPVGDLPEVDVPPVLVQTAPKKRTRKGKKMIVWPADNNKVFEEHTVTGELAGSSAAAIGVIGTASLAVELMHKAGVAMNKKPAVTSMTNMLGWIITDIQRKTSATGEVDWQSGLNTRIRGVLRTVLELNPAPFGETDPDVWKEWGATVVKRSVAIMDAGHELYTNGAGDEPWDAVVEWCSNVNPWKDAE